MKRYVLLIGGGGARMADALLCAAEAGVFPRETLHVLLTDTDSSALRSAPMVAAQMADYERIHKSIGAMDDMFRTKLVFRAWLEKLPEELSSLSRLAANEETDELLCQALMDSGAAGVDLHAGFHGRRMLAQVAFAGLLQRADSDLDDVLGAMVDEMAQAAAEGEEIRVVLAGSVCSGAGAAGIPMLARYIAERVQGTLRMGAVLMAACTEQESAERAREAIAQYARDGLCGTVCVLGLPHASRTPAPAEYARLTDWLGVYCTDVLLHRPQWLEGVFTVRAPEGPLSWAIFGKAEKRYRLAYGRLMKAAAAWTYSLGPVVEKRLEKPMFLRDKLFGWYAHYFRRADMSREDMLDDADCITRLMSVALLWLGGVCRTLPTDLRYGMAMKEARDEAEEHYRVLADMVGHLCVLDEEASRTEEYVDSFVHRYDEDDDDEAEETLRRVDAVKMEIKRREAAQETLNRRMGGDSVMHMLGNALEKARQDDERLQAQYQEANRRIEHAESIASTEDQYRIADARTKLKRMERHRAMLESRVKYIQEDMDRAVSEETRFEKPAMTPKVAENAMFHPEIVASLLRREGPEKQLIENMWNRMVLPADGQSFKELMREIRRESADPRQPVIRLWHALSQCAMKEGEA